MKKKEVEKTDKNKHFIHLLNYLILKQYKSQKIDKENLNKIYKGAIKINRNTFYKLSSNILKYYHKKPRISYDSEKIIEIDNFIECKVNLCFFI